MTDVLLFKCFYQDIENLQATLNSSPLQSLPAFRSVLSFYLALEEYICLEYWLNFQNVGYLRKMF